jgi:type IV secretion system protein VirB1
MDFLALALSCAPAIHPVTLAAVVRTESFYDPLVVRDNTLRVTFYPRTLQAAGELIERAEADHHKLAVGLMQVTSTWAKQLHMNARVLLDPCTNLAIGSQILAQDYLSCAPGGEPAGRLACALSLYWSGTQRKGGVYVNRVYRAAGSPVRVPETPGITDGILGQSMPPISDVTYNGQVVYTAQGSTTGFDFPHR